MSKEQCVPGAIVVPTEYCKNMFPVFKKYDTSFKLFMGAYGEMGIRHIKSGKVLYENFISMKQSDFDQWFTVKKQDFKHRLIELF